MTAAIFFKRCAAALIDVVSGVITALCLNSIYHGLIKVFPYRFAEKMMEIHPVHVIEWLFILTSVLCLLFVLSGQIRFTAISLKKKLLLPLIIAFSGIMVSFMITKISDIFLWKYNKTLEKIVSSAMQKDSETVEVINDCGFTGIFISEGWLNEAKNLIAGGIDEKTARMLEFERNDSGLITFKAIKDEMVFSVNRGAAFSVKNGYYYAKTGKIIRLHFLRGKDGRRILDRVE